ncbi:MAG: AcrR family transcriptional regulator [Chlamydiales bacterium]|jgi:AcrR family transcriptional regulator
MAPSDTQQRLLEAAERLFGSLGFAETSLRALTGAASTNLAAVNYHFGSKEGLFKAVVERVVAPVNRERLRLLDELEGRSGGQTPNIEDVLRAFFGPALAVGTRPDAEGERMRKLMGRIRFEGTPLDESVHEVFNEVEARFGPVFMRALPHLAPKGLFWRLHFALGVMCSTMFNPNQVQLISNGLCDPTDVQDALDQMVRFVSAGFMSADVECQQKVME